MYDKTVRRRRAVLVLLVVLSLLLLTAYFGEAPSGRLHGVQRAFLTVVSPIQDGANKALKPVRDLFGWFGDTLHAKSQRDELRKQIDKLRRELVADQAEKRSYRQLLALYHLDQLGRRRLPPGDRHGRRQIAQHLVLDGRRSTRAQSPACASTTRSSTAKASSARSPRWPPTAPRWTSSPTARWASRRASARATRPASCSPRSANPTTCCCSTCRPPPQANQGEYVVTSGTVSSPDDSLYPPGILIGQVTSVNEESAYKSVNVHPSANLHEPRRRAGADLGAPARSAAQPRQRWPPSCPAGQGSAAGEAAANSSPRPGSGG